MKKFFLILAVALSGTWAHATLQLMSGSGTISGGDGFGYVFSGTYTGLPAPIEPLGYNVEVQLNITGGYNEGLYAYIIAPDGTASALIADSGTLYSGATPANPGTEHINFFNYAGSTIAGVIGEATINDTVRPADAPIIISDATIAAWGSQNWSLLIGYSDTSYAGATLNSWSLDLVPVPEPVSLSLGIFAAMLLCLAGVNRFWRTSVAAKNPRTERLSALNGVSASL